MGLRVKKGDTVEVIAGKERGKRGRVIAVLPKRQRVIVEKVNIVKRHMKPSRKYTQGGIIEKEAPVHISNVMLLCPKCGQRTRVAARLLEDGRKLRACKKCQEVIDS
jgi:large subunit ribosomal protein L24